MKEDKTNRQTTIKPAVWCQNGTPRSPSIVESFPVIRHVMTVAPVGSGENHNFRPPRFLGGSLCLVKMRREIGAETGLDRQRRKIVKTMRRIDIVASFR
jgi:hypothetical protein